MVFQSDLIRPCCLGTCLVVLNSSEVYFTISLRKNSVQYLKILSFLSYKVTYLKPTRMHPARHSRLKCALHFSEGIFLLPKTVGLLWDDTKLNIIQTNIVKHSSMTGNHQYSDIIVSATCDWERKEEIYFKVVLFTADLTRFAFQKIKRKWGGFLCKLFFRSDPLYFIENKLWLYNICPQDIFFFRCQKRNGIQYQSSQLHLVWKSELWVRVQSRVKVAWEVTNSQNVLSKSAGLWSMRSWICSIF